MNESKYLAPLAETSLSSVYETRVRREVASHAHRPSPPPWSSARHPPRVREAGIRSPAGLYPYCSTVGCALPLQEAAPLLDPSIFLLSLLSLSLLPDALQCYLSYTVLVFNLILRLLPAILCFCWFIFCHIRLGYVLSPSLVIHTGYVLSPFLVLQGPYAPQGSTPLLPKLSVTSKVSAPTSHAWVGSLVHFRSSEDVTLLEFTSPIDRE